MRLMHSWDVRKAITAGELTADLTGPRAALGRQWMILEGLSTIVPGTCCIGPPILVLAVLGNKSAKTGAVPAGNTPPMSSSAAPIAGGAEPVTGDTALTISQVPVMEKGQQWSLATTEWKQRRTEIE
jgi:hypothetical protein